MGQSGSALNVIIVHPSWFYPSSGIKNRSPESQYFGQQKFDFSYYLMRLMRIDVDADAMWMQI